MAKLMINQTGKLNFCSDQGSICGEGRVGVVFKTLSRMF